MPSLRDSTRPPLPRIDLSRPTEATRRALYDVIVADYFEPWTAEEIAEAIREGEWFLDHGPDDAGVQVVYLFGRWFAWWRDLSVKDSDPPEVPRWQIVSIDSKVEPGVPQPHEISFSEV